MRDRYYCSSVALEGNGINYVAVALHALKRLPPELREMLRARGDWEDVVAWALVAAVEGWRRGYDFRATYNAAQRYIYCALRAAGFRRLSRKHGSAMMYVCDETPTADLDSVAF